MQVTSKQLLMELQYIQVQQESSYITEQRLHLERQRSLIIQMVRNHSNLVVKQVFIMWQLTVMRVVPTPLQLFQGHRAYRHQQLIWEVQQQFRFQEHRLHLHIP